MFDFVALICCGAALLGIYAAALAQTIPTGSNTSATIRSIGVTFSALPAANAGTVQYMTDGLAANCADTTCTTFGTAVTGGGGALKLLVWYNGAAWTLVGK